MFCEKCGTQNNDSNTNCVNCGAPLYGTQPQYQQPQYQQPQQPQQQYGYNQPQQYGYQPQPLAANGSKPTVLYIIAGIIAALLVLFLFLPHLSIRGQGAYIPFAIIIESTKASGFVSSDAAGALGAFMVLLIIPMGLEIVWAIMSFMMKRPAGIFGVIACSIGFFVYMIWMVLMLACGNIYGVTCLPFPVFMFLFSIAGIPVSIVQIVKKKYL